MIKLSKIQCLFFGLALILLGYSINRLRHIIGSEKVTGKFVFYIDETVNQENMSFPIIEYVMPDSVYQFRAKENTHYEPGETVSVLLENKDPDHPLLYTVGSFWLFPLVYLILPVLLWVSFILSYINKNEIVKISFKNPFFRKEKK